LRALLDPPDDFELRDDDLLVERAGDELLRDDDGLFTVRLLVPDERRVFGFDLILGGDFLVVVLLFFRTEELDSLLLFDLPDGRFRSTVLSVPWLRVVPERTREEGFLLDRRASSASLDRWVREPV